jgi:shikimate dehydrogenase
VLSSCRERQEDSDKMGRSSLNKLSFKPPSEPGRFLTGLIGTNIGGSRSPWLHEQEADAQGVRLIYMLYDFAELGGSDADLPAMLDSARRLGFSGLNITHPFKQSVIPYLDALSDEASRIGAVNTVAFKEGRTLGYNTDCLGFAESFARELPDVSLELVVQLGAGGAGAATAHALLGRGANHLVLFDKDATRARALAERLATHYGRDRISVASDLGSAVARANGIVNATPVGMDEYPGMPVSKESLRREMWVADIVYFPLETELLRIARARGCRTMSGGDMAVFQAADAFRLFTGLEPDSERMLKHFASM